MQRAHDEQCSFDGQEACVRCVGVGTGETRSCYFLTGRLSRSPKFPLPSHNSKLVIHGGIVLAGTLPILTRAACLGLCFGIYLFGVLRIFMSLIIIGKSFSLLHALFFFCNSDCTLNNLCPQFLASVLCAFLFVNRFGSFVFGNISWPVFHRFLNCVRCHSEPLEVILHCCCCAFIFSISI